MKPIWRLVDTGHRSGAENMALDEVFLTARSRNLVPNTIRFLQFRPDCASIGYFQAVEQELHQDYCQQHQIEISRRLTGGGAIYFNESTIGWELYAGKDSPLFTNSIEELYARLCEGVVEGLRSLGVKARFRPRNDIEVEGRKISGTGGTELGAAFLFQGTLLVDFDAEKMLQVLNIPVEKMKGRELESVKQRVVCLKELLGYAPNNGRIKAALAQGLATVLAIELEQSPLTNWEEEMLARRLPYFASADWVHKVRKKDSHRKSVSAVYKGAGGLIRASLVVDVPGKRIKSALLTGDFFAYPGRVIMDLETALKDSRAETEEVTRIVEQSFRKGKAKLPGLTEDDFSKAIMQAVAMAYGERN